MSQIELSAFAEFCAAVRVAGFGELCDHLHGHTYRVEACLTWDSQAEPLDGYAVQKHLDNICQAFDHSYLNDLEGFQGQTPSLENIAATIAHQMLEADWSQAQLLYVDVAESQRFRVRYRPTSP